MSIVQFIPQNYLYIVRNLETTPIIVGVLAGPTLNAIGINTGLDAVDYYGEVHLSKWNSIIHTVGMPFTTYGFAVAAPALFNLKNEQGKYLQKCLLIVYFIHYLTFDPILAVFMFFFYSFPLYFAMQTYVWTENKKELVSYGLKTAAGALFFQEVIGHTIGGDDQSRLEAIPNAIVYAMHYSISHIIRL
jgi:hypothetical protein